ncbi:MAG: EAL domain-containing protein [Methyloprofundus sp.]|nr:EAL domain-containing protein [Methyloprofundus sp.]
MLKSDKQLKVFQLIGINLAVACGYIVLGYLGSFLIIPPSIASSIWPPIGLALAVVLVYGKPVVPGLFFGALFFNIYSFTDFSISETIAASLIVAVVSSFGLCIQAIFAAFLINRFLGKDTPLTQDSEIIRFFLLGAPVACLVSSTIGVATIFLQGFIVVAAIPISWVTWWIGDCIGMILFTPIILAFIARPKKIWKIRRKLVAYPLFFMFVFVVTIFQYNQKLDAERIELLFARQVSAFHTTFSARVIEHVEINQVLKGFFDSAQFITEKEFATFTRPILKHHNFQALEWISFVPAEQREDFEQSNLIIRQPNLANKLVPATGRESYFPITYVQPLADNQRALGFDISTNPIAFKAVVEAMEMGKTSITAPIQLVQDLDKKTGFVLYSPVYIQGKQAAYFENRSTLKGLVASLFRIADAVESSYIELPDVDLQLKIEVGQQIIFGNFTETDSASLNLFSLQHTRQIKVANQTWHITYQPSANFYHTQITWTIWWLYLSGFIVTGLIGMGLLMLSGRTLRTEELVQLRTRDLAKSEERWQFALEGNRDGVWDWNVSTDEVFFSTQFKEMHGYSDAEFPNHIDEWDKRIHTDDKERVYADINNYFAHKTAQYENEHRVLCKDGSYQWVLARGKVVAWTDDDKPMRMIGTHMNITARKLAEEKLRLSAQVFNETKEAIIITDTQSLIVEINPAFSEITGYSYAEAVGQNPSFLSSGKQSPEFYAEMWQAVNTKGHWHGEVWNRKKNGELYVELLTISAIQDEHTHEVSHYVGLFSDITESKEQQSALELMAHYDVLTHLPNRVLFADRFTLATAHSKRMDTLLAICFLDLDGFKPVNDKYGHTVGDQLLVEVALRIKAGIREEDTVSRQGGDEFTLLLGNIESVFQCEQMMDRLHNSLAQPYLIEGQRINISASSGVTLYPTDNADLDTLIRHADQAMYQAKVVGRNRYQLFSTEEDLLIIQKHNQLDAIQQALTNNEFCLYYQPKVNMKTGQVFGAEALIRWLHPEKGLIPPLQFLPIIEDTELENLIGDWVIRQALQQLAQWQEHDINIEVSVNISSYHLQSNSFFADLEAALAKHPSISHQYFQLEILESSALGDLETISRVINSCRDRLGINIALDDFGTGYSSLTHLRSLAANTIKIDQSFVRDMLDDPNDYAIIDGVIGLADSFSREVIAEGVETTEHGLMLLLMGCDNAQGYGIAKPMPAEELPDWLVHYKPNAEWLNIANKERSLKETRVTLLRLTTAHWYEKFTSSVLQEQSNQSDWLNAGLGRCHLERWLQRAKQDHLFDENWVNKLDAVHLLMHSTAGSIFDKYKQGQIGAARQELDELRVSFAKITNVLGEWE